VDETTKWLRSAAKGPAAKFSPHRPVNCCFAEAIDEIDRRRANRDTMIELTDKRFLFPNTRLGRRVHPPLASFVAGSVLLIVTLNTSEGIASPISNVITQNTIGFSQGYPVGVPEDFAWYSGSYKPSGYSTPPSGFTAVTGWGQVYQRAGAPAYSNPSATVHVANAETYVKRKTTGQWILVQDQTTNKIAGRHFLSDFAKNTAIEMKMHTLPDGSAALAIPPTGYNNHFWHSKRGTFPADEVTAVYVQMDMRVSDPMLRLIANVGADWWRTASAKFVHGFANNPGAGMSNWIELSTRWSTLAFYSSTTEQFKDDPPPMLRQSAQK
jgi:hypothetical protein